MDQNEFNKIRYDLLMNRLSFSDTKLLLEVNESAKHFIVSNDILLLKSCSPIIKNDRDTVLEIVKVNGNNLRLLKHAFKDDEEIVWAALKATPTVFQYTSKRFKENDDMVNFVLTHAPSQIMYCTERFKRDKELVEKLLKQDFKLFQYIHPSLKNDLGIVFKAWEVIKEKFTDSVYSIHSQTSWLIEHMGEKINRQFDDINFTNNSTLLINQMDSHFTNLILHRELKKELAQTNQTESKKMKI